MTLLLVGLGLLLVFGFVEVAGASTGGAQRLAAAIEVAEGYGVADARPTRNNNPGDLMNWPGSGFPSDSAGYVAFPDYQTGFSYLLAKCQAILTGTDPAVSELAQQEFGVANTASLTIGQLAQIYSPAGANNWAANVSAELGVSEDTAIGTL